MFQLIERPVFFPGRTLFGDTQGPVVDTSVELVAGGHVYLSVVEAIHVGKAVDMVEGNVHDSLLAERDATITELMAEVAELEEKVAAGVQVVPVDQIREMIAAGVQAGGKRKAA